MSTALSSAGAGRWRWCAGLDIGRGRRTDATAADQRQEIDSGRPAEDEHQQQAADAETAGAHAHATGTARARPRCCLDRRSSTSYGSSRFSNRAGCAVAKRAPVEPGRINDRGLSLFDHDAPPLGLVESRHRQDAARGMSEQNRRPDARRLEAPHRLERRAQADRHGHLRYQRDVERAARVTGALQPARVRQCHGDEERRHTEVAQQLFPERHDDRVLETEDGQQLLGDEQEHAR